jgi:hypothetical protein
MGLFGAILSQIRSRQDLYRMLMLTNFTEILMQMFGAQMGGGSRGGGGFHSKQNHFLYC